MTYTDAPREKSDARAHVNRLPKLVTTFKGKEIALNLDIPIYHVGHHVGLKGDAFK